MKQNLLDEKKIPKESLLPKHTHAEILPVEISPGFHAMDLALYVPADDCLILGDLQLGMEEQYNNQGIFIPRFNFREVKQHLKLIFDKRTRVKTIFLNGDIKHGFGNASNQEWREVIELLELLSEHSDEIIIIKGNHDIAIEPIARFAKVKVEKNGVFLTHTQTYVCHGHEIPKDEKYEDASTVIIGHDHPAIELKDGATRQKYKCFLVGNFERKRIIVLPSFNFAAPGSDPREGALSPFLQKKLDHFRAWLVEDNVYDFGLLEKLG
jgi:hypothetical protein